MELLFEWTRISYTEIGKLLSESEEAYSLQWLPLR